MVRAADGQAELKNVRNFKLGSSPIRQILPEERRKGFAPSTTAAASASSTAPHTARCSRSRSPMAPRWRPCRRAPHVCCWSRRRGCSASSSTTRTRRLGVRCGQGLVRELSGARLRLAIHLRQQRFRTQAEPCAAGVRHAQGSLYAMLLAALLAICAAFYTAYFMAPSLRRKVAGDRADGGAADGDSRFLRRPVPRAVPGEPPAWHLRPAAADAGGHPLRRSTGAACRKACAWRSRKAGKRCC